MDHLKNIVCFCFFLFTLIPQMEPAWRCNCCPLHHWDCIGRDRRSSIPNQPDDHPGDASSSNCPSSQTPEDGKGDSRTVGHCDAGLTTGDHLPQIPSSALLSSPGGKPWPSFLPSLLHICCPWCRDVRSPRWVPMIMGDGRKGQIYICYSRVRPLRWF